MRKISIIKDISKYTFLILFIYIFPNNYITCQSLEEYIQIAKQNSSQLQYKKLDYMIAQEKVNEVGTFKNTNFTFGAFAITPETRVGPQIAKIGINQELPWFGKNNLEKEYMYMTAKLIDKNERITSYAIINESGQIINYHKIHKNEIANMYSFPIFEYSPGIYFIKIYTKEGIYTKQFVKK